MDEQERHFIGDLLSNEDEPFSPKSPQLSAINSPSPLTNPSQHRQSSDNFNTSSSPSVLPGGCSGVQNAAAGPVGRPPPSGGYWPEPPPPYTECPPQWASLKQPGGAPTISYHPYSFHHGPHHHPQAFAHHPHQGGPFMGHPPPQGPHHHPVIAPHLSQQNMVLTQPATVPSSNTFQVHLPAGTVLTPALNPAGLSHHHQVVPQGIAGLPMGTQGQWDSVYTPFGGPQPGQVNPGHGMCVDSAAHHAGGNTGLEIGIADAEPGLRLRSGNQRREKSPKMASLGAGNKENVTKLPKAGKSYRDVAVASAKPPIHPNSGLKRMDSPTLRSAGDHHHQYTRKYSAGNLGDTSLRQSSSESQSETGFGVAHPISAKAVHVGDDNYSDSDGDRGDIYDDREKLQGILQKGDGTLNEKNLSRRNVTTNTGVSNEFQKIERKKNRRATSPPKVAPSADGSRKESRTGFDILANSPKNRKNQQAERMGMGRNEAYGSGAAFRSMKLNNEDAIEAQYRSKSQTRKTAYINNDFTSDDGVDDDENDDIFDRKTAKGGVGKPGDKKDMGKGRRGKRRDDSNRGRRNRKGNLSPIFYWIGVVCWTIGTYCQSVARWLIDLITDIGCQLWDITVHCSKELYTKVTVGLQMAWYKTGDKIRNCFVRFRQREWLSLKFWRRKKKQCETWGLEENITLPSTGEEAMRRLLSNRGQDAYSILGLRADCSDEDIKRYYKRQAVLVHPDKNVAYGADEAFKILHHAYGMIDKPETRQQYNIGNLHRTKEMQEFEELLEKLRQKVEEALSTMHCDCGNKHRRFVTKRTVSEARYCKRCKDYHSARENDIWAESQWFGFLWYYYACMDNAIYDITEWAGCPKNLLKHMKPNSHLVQYRLITGQHNRKQNSSGHGRPQSDADVDAIFGMLDKGRRGGSSFLDKLNPDLNPGAAGASGTPGPSEGGLFGPQSASYRPPSFAGGDSGRPRKAGRRRKK